MRVLETRNGLVTFGSYFRGRYVRRGCAATINYSYDPVADCLAGKNYSWASGMSKNRPDVLIEKNVRYYARPISQERVSP